MRTMYDFPPVKSYVDVYLSESQAFTMSYSKSW